MSVHNAEDKSVIDHFEGVNPVHRLDKETSGILLLSRDSAITAKLQEALKRAQKKYICVCRKPMASQTGYWQSPLSEKAQGFRDPQGPKIDRKKCQSEWSVVQQNRYLSLLEVTIRTGRTHQIRRHACLSGHQVIGDSRYGDRKFNKKMQNMYQYNRMFLHATSLEFLWDGRQIEVEAKVPEEFYTIFTGSA